MAWKILFFETTRGEKVVKEFIKSLDSTTTAKATHAISLLAKHGPYLGMPHARKLEAHLYELRIRSKQELRIIYIFLEGKIYLLHAFQKKTRKTPQKEINTALKRVALIT